MAEENREVSGRLRRLEEELYAIRSSSTWQLAQRVQALTSAARKILRGRAPVRSIAVKVTNLGPTIHMRVEVAPRIGPTDLVLCLSLGPTELLQQSVNLLTHRNGDDSDVLVSAIGNDIWSVTWAPSTPIGDYHPSQLQVRVGGFPDGVVTYAEGALAAGESPRRHPSGRTSIEHLLNSVREIRPLDPAFAADPTGAKVAIVSTFSPRGRPLGAVRELLHELRQMGLHTVVVDTSPDWALGGVSDLGDIASVYVRRANIGWDFSSWISTHTHPELVHLVDRASEVLWINDSCYGPITPLEPLLEQAEKRGDDLWGLTSSNQITAHVQSFLLRYSRKALDAGLIDAFIAGYPFPTVKSDIILNGEVRLTEVAKHLGLSIGVAFPYEDVVAQYLATWEHRMTELLEDPVVKAYRLLDELHNCRRHRYHLILREAVENGIPRNASHEMWDTLLEMGFPMIKRELVASNPQEVPINHLYAQTRAASPRWAEIMRLERSIDG